MSWLTPQTATPPEPDPARPDMNLAEAQRHLGSYRIMRTAIGVIGLALPVVLLVGDGLFLEGSVLPRGSLSAYYHSGMRDVFVGTLCATAIFLITYKVAEQNLDNTLSIVAGVAALGVAVFPTGRPAMATTPATPLQEVLGEHPVAMIHFTCAAVFVLALAVISFYFGVRAANDTTRRTPRSRRFWRDLHRTCAALIVAAVLGIVVTQVTGVLDEHGLLIGEIVAILAFGVSWLCKGLHLGELTRPAEPSTAAAA